MQSPWYPRPKWVGGCSLITQPGHHKSKNHFPNRRIENRILHSYREEASFRIWNTQASWWQEYLDRFLGSMEEQHKRRIAKRSSNAQTAEETALLLPTPDVSGCNTGRVWFLRLRTGRSQLIPDVFGVHIGRVQYAGQHRATLGEKKTYQTVSKNNDILTRETRHLREDLHQISD